MAKQHKISEQSILSSSEENIRRLCKFLGIEDFETKSKILLIDELQWKGFVESSIKFGWY